jgi:hypothetical protein
MTGSAFSKKKYQPRHAAAVAKPWWKANEGKPAACNTSIEQRRERDKNMIVIPPKDPYGM